MVNGDLRNKLCYKLARARFAPGHFVLMTVAGNMASNGQIPAPEITEANSRTESRETTLGSSLDDAHLRHA